MKLSLPGYPQCPERKQGESALWTRCHTGGAAVSRRDTAFPGGCDPVWGVQVPPHRDIATQSCHRTQSHRDGQQLGMQVHHHADTGRDVITPR